MVPSRRFSLDYPVVLASTKDWEPGHRKKLQVYMGNTANLSLSGLAIDLENSDGLTLNQEVVLQVKYQPPNKMFRVGAGKPKGISAKAQVIWKEGSRVGLEILQFSENSQDRYESIIEGYRTLSDFIPQGGGHL